MSFTLPPLPYAIDALEPHISKETLQYHYGKHHQTYVDNLNKLVVDTPYVGQPLEAIIKQAEGPIFNNAAQVWNHTFYWHCLSPQGGGTPKGKLADMIDRDFGSFEKFKEQFSQTAATTFGSGWAWLIQDASGKLSITSTGNAGTPMVNNHTALLTCDVWEHAYYIDYRNARVAYIQAFWNIVNWEFVSNLLQS